MSETFLSRWTRRKEAVRVAERPAAPPPAEPALQETPEEARAAPEIAERAESATHELLADLPSLDTLTPETDLSAFLRAGVPTALRNAALRRMWSLDPSIRDFVSEAREYAYDWNTPGGVPGLGPLLPTDDVKAMLGRLIGTSREPSAEPLPQAVAAAAGEPEAPESPGSEPDPASTDEADVPVAIEAPPPAVLAPDAPVPDAKPASTPAPARLRRHGGAMPA